jgi:hypothetical protein
MIEIPLLNSVSQEFVITLDGVNYKLLVKYNDRAGIWTMDITENVSKKILVEGVPLVLGQALLEPYNFGMGEMMVYDNSDKGTEADFDNWETQNVLVWFSASEVAALG